jgi:uncharacterized FlaG/YvyC family protein
MRIDGPTPVIDHSFTAARDPIEIQAQNREIIQAVRAVNASQQLGDSTELVFSLDRQTRRPIIRVVDRNTNEVVLQIPDEQILRLAQQLKIPVATDK